MNKKQKIILIIWTILFVLVGISWLSAGPYCVHANEYSECRYTWDLSGLIGKLLIISGPATILYRLFKG